MRKLPRSPPVVRWASSISTKMFLPRVEVRRHVAELVDHRDDDAAIILPFSSSSLFSVAMRSACATFAMPTAARFLQHLVFQLVAVDHEQDGRLSAPRSP